MSGVTIAPNRARRAWASTPPRFTPLLPRGWFGCQTPLVPQFPCRELSAPGLTSGSQPDLGRCNVRQNSFPCTGAKDS